MTNNPDVKKYRTELPNIIDDLGLDPYQSALYRHYKRVCGGDDGACTEGIRKTAKHTKMSTAKVSFVRRELVDKGLIQVSEVGQYIHVKIVDIWKLNSAYYSLLNRPDIDGWTVQELSNFIQSVCTVNTSVSEVNALDEKCLPDKQSVYMVNESGEKRLPRKTKKEQVLKKEPYKKLSTKKPPLPVIPSVQVFVKVTGKHILNKVQMETLAEKIGNSLENLERWENVVKAWLNNGYRPTNLSGMLDWFENGIPSYTKNNGARNGSHQKSGNVISGKSLQSENTFNPFTGEIIPGVP